MHNSFTNHAGSRYLHLSLVLVVVSVAAYIWHDPVTVANGGTWLGFTLGGLSAFIVLLLLWFGIRKRRYRSRMGTVRGWLSAHIYLGLSLIVLATLHAGFQFHWNIHTLAYVLMMLVILSGIWGTVTYLRNPNLLSQLDQGQSRKMMIARMRELEEESLALADRIGPQTHQLVAAALQPIRLPGTWRRLLRSRGTGNVVADRHFSADGKTWKLEGKLAQALAESRDADQIEKLRDLMASVARRRNHSLRLGRELQLQAQVKAWLMLHVPLSMGLLAALIAHVVAVFFYR